MSKVTRSVLGNRSDEEGAHDSGADFEQLNQSAMPPPMEEPIEVDVVKVEGGIEVVPVHEIESFWRALGELEEGPTDLLMAQLVEEPEEYGLVKKNVNGVVVEAREDRLAEIGKRGPRERLVWYRSHPEYMQAMAGDRLLIRKDTLELEDACRSCHGRGYTEEICPLCQGAKTFENGDTCGECLVLGYDIEKQWSSGRVPCKSCFGSGWRGGVVIPQVAERKPITGIVVSVGPECRLYKLGDRVIHSRFAGHEMSVAKNETFTMMRESEVLSILKQRRAG